MAKVSGRHFGNSPRTCIFCGEAREMSKEHVFPDWIGQSIKKDERAWHPEFRMMPDGTIPKFVKKNGHAFTRKIRNVCARCNNTWMSALENKNKSVLEKLMRSEIHLASVEEQKSIAEWAILKTIVQDCFRNPDKSIASMEDRRKIFEEGIFPSGWAVWIGRIDAPFWECSYFYSDISLNPREATSDGPFNSAGISIYTMGCLFLYVVSNNSEITLIEFTNPANLLRQIYPRPDGKLLWPAVDLISPKEFLSYLNGASSNFEDMGSEIPRIRRGVIRNDG
ncbi:hypothetical protein [Methylobacterium komagatae]